MPLWAIITWWPCYRCWIIWWVENEIKGLERLKANRVNINIGKTKVMCSRHDARNTKITSVEFPCGICWKDVGANSIFCVNWKKWVHEQCSGIREGLRNCNRFICNTCSTAAVANDCFSKCITIDGNEFEIVNEFCCLGNVMGRTGRCIGTVTAHTWSAGRAFYELLPTLTNRCISLSNWGKVFKSWVRNLLLYRDETWPLSTGDLSRIKTKDHAMIPWVCSVKIKQQHSTDELRRRLRLQHTEDVLRWNRLQLSGHLYQQGKASWTTKIINFVVDVVNNDWCKKCLSLSLARNGEMPSDQWQ